MNRRIAVTVVMMMVVASAVTVIVTTRRFQLMVGNHLMILRLHLAVIMTIVTVVVIEIAVR